MTGSISIAIAENIELILSALGINDYRVYPTRVAMPCPIHGSDNFDSLSIVTDGEYTGIWRCWTKSCEEDKIYDIINGKLVKVRRGKSALAFVRSVLSILNNKVVSTSEAAEWVEEVLGSKSLCVSKKPSALHVASNKDNQYLNIPREIFISGLEKLSPSQSSVCAELIEKYGMNTLTEFDIGYKYRTRSVIFPVYGCTKDFVLSYIARTTFPKCSTCGKHHKPYHNCANGVPKWRTAPRARIGTLLYNWWNAKVPAKRQGEIILVEGPKDVLSFYNAGAVNVVGLFGTSLSSHQATMIYDNGIRKLLVALDNDDAGDKGFERIQRIYGSHFNIVRIDITSDDPGQCSIEELKELINNEH